MYGFYILFRSKINLSINFPSKLKLLGIVLKVKLIIKTKTLSNYNPLRLKR